MAAGAAALAILPDRPPVAHTGGFGEPTCQECHTGNPLNDPSGSLVLRGVPSQYRPGHSYAITVRLARKNIGRGGFELSARIGQGQDAGHQAGQITASDARINLADTTTSAFGRVLYARHTQAGSEPGKSDTLEWTIQWTAPAKGTGAVIFNAAGNAANDDNSPVGDYIYKTSATSPEIRLR